MLTKSVKEVLWKTVSVDGCLCFHKRKAILSPTVFHPTLKCGCGYAALRSSVLIFCGSNTTEKFLTFVGSRRNRIIDLSDGSLGYKIGFVSPWRETLDHSSEEQGLVKQQARNGVPPQNATSGNRCLRVLFDNR